MILNRLQYTYNSVCKMAFRIIKIFKKCFTKLEENNSNENLFIIFSNCV